MVQKTNVRDQAEALHDEGPTNDESELLQTGAFKILQEQGVCLGYSSTIITICFEPTDATEYEEDLEIVCSVKQNGPVRTEPEIFHVHLQVCCNMLLPHCLFNERCWKFCSWV